MSATPFVAQTAARRLLIGGFLAVAVTVPGGSAFAAETTLRATYYIALAGFTIGRVLVDSRLADDGYATVIDGSTYGLSRLVSDSRAVLIGHGAIDGSDVLPSDFTYVTSEGGYESRVNMALADHAVVELAADPELTDAPDRIPLTPDHRRRIVDPVSAFIVSMAGAVKTDGESVCNRTVPVFDGWQRFDIELQYKRTETVNGRTDSYSGPVFVCAARYVPVAGHRVTRDAIQYMAENERLEVWMAPVVDTPLLIPHRVVIGTKIGDLTVYAHEFVVTTDDRQASIE